jgi:hypothetical protein
MAAPPLPRLVPWRSWAEWRQVLALLREEEPASLRGAVERMTLWALRTPRLALPLASTAALLRLRVLELSALTAAGNRRGEEELRLQYAMTLTRYLLASASLAALT